MVQAVGNVLFGEDTRTLAQAQADMCAAAAAAFSARLDAGYTVAEGQAVAIDDGARADLGGMALTASFVAQGAQGISWPASYAQGWICLDGSRFALPTPQDGIALAYGAGVYYSELAQNEQTLCNAVNATTDKASALAIDLTQGWPA